MTPRESIDIATAALRWHTARERRLAAGAEKRRADAAYRDRWTGVAGAALAVGQQLIRADAAVTETRRQERAAVRALGKACAKARSDMQAVDVLDTSCAAATGPLRASTTPQQREGRVRSCQPRPTGNGTVPHVQKISPFW